jgi:O-antigen ligase
MSAIAQDLAGAPDREARPGKARTGSRLPAVHWVVLALVFMSVGRAQDHVPLLSLFRPALLLTALSLLLSLLQPKAVRFDNLTQTAMGKAVLSLVAVAAISTVTGMSIGGSGSFVLTSYLPVLVGFAMCHVMMTGSRQLYLMTVTYVLATATVAFASIFLSDAMSFGGYVRQGGAGMYDGNDVGVVFMVGLPLAIALIQGGTRPLQRRIGWITAAGAIAGLVLTASRGGFIGLVIGGSAILVLAPGIGMLKKVGFVLITVVGMTVAAPQGYWDQMATILNPSEDYNITSETGRLAIWTRGLGYVAEYPVFGVGPDNFVRAGWYISDTGRAGLVGASIQDQAPHNTFLQVWAELGTVGLAVWLSILGMGIFAPLRWRKRLPRSWSKSPHGDEKFIFLLCTYVPVAFLGFAVTTFFVSHAYTPILYVLTAIWAGLSLQIHGLRGKSSPSASKHLQSMQVRPPPGAPGPFGASRQ